MLEPTADLCATLMELPHTAGLEAAPAGLAAAHRGAMAARRAGKEG